VLDLKNFLEGKPSSYTRVELPVPAASKEVKAVRKAVHQTQRQFAQVVGVSLETVKAWEAGKRVPEGAATKLMRLLLEEPAMALRLAKL
jgi:putative transcriptional regulator